MDKASLKQVKSNKAESKTNYVLKKGIVTAREVTAEFAYIRLLPYVKQ